MLFKTSPEVGEWALSPGFRLGRRFRLRLGRNVGIRYRFGTWYRSELAARLASEPPHPLGDEPHHGADQRAPQRVRKNRPALPRRGGRIDDRERDDPGQPRRRDRLECRCLLLCDLLRAKTVGGVVLHAHECGRRHGRDVEVCADGVRRDAERVRDVSDHGGARRERPHGGEHDRRVVRLREEGRRGPVRR
jgi:hypothetical protein